MTRSSATKHQFLQLEAVLESPIIMLEHNDQALIILKAKQLLKTSRHCSIVAATSTSNQTLRNIITLYRSFAILKKLKRQLCSDSSVENTSLIGIYPSLEYPACVYELRTNADRYVSANVLPYASSTYMMVIRYLFRKIIGVNPDVGGLGLILSKD